MLRSKYESELKREKNSKNEYKKTNAQRIKEQRQ
jgi:hypothetical protein